MSHVSHTHTHVQSYLTYSVPTYSSPGMEWREWMRVITHRPSSRKVMHLIYLDLRSAGYLDVVTKAKYVLHDKLAYLFGTR